MPQQPPDISDADAEIWKEYTDTVQKTKQPEEPPYAPLYIDAVKPGISYKNIPHAHQLPTLAVGDLEGMDGNTAKRFKRCEYKIEATLDLHGKTEKEAYRAVFQFIKQSYLKNKRCILIITGKGLTIDENDIFSFKGKLKERTPIWLNSEELRPLILGFIHPIASLGGSGALYIMLRKKR